MTYCLNLMPYLVLELMDREVAGLDIQVPIATKTQHILRKEINKM